MRSKIIRIMTALALVFGLTACQSRPADPLAAVSRYLKANVQPAYGYEWIVLTMKQADQEPTAGFYADYLTAVQKELAADGGKLDGQATTFARTAMAVTAAGGDPAAIGGRDLTVGLTDAALADRQGINGAIFDLIAMSYCGIDDGPAQEAFLGVLLAGQLDDGGYSFSSSSADTDMTAMAIQALSLYRQDTAQEACRQAVACLAGLQKDDGSFASWGTVNCESLCQAIIAMCAAGIPVDDARFVKGGTDVYQTLLKYQTSEGGFVHELGDGQTSLAASVQAYMALTALYDMKTYGSGLFSRH
mgnify:CR=1 FL=1